MDLNLNYFAMKLKFKNHLFYTLAICLAFSAFEGLQAFSGKTGLPGLSATATVGGAYLLFAGRFGGEVSKKEIAEQKELAVEGCAKGSRIFQYTLVVTKGNQTFTYKASSNALTMEMQAKLKSLAAGDSFEFTQIKAYLPDGKDVVDVHGKKFNVI
jgi:hypothetical protein